MGRDGRVRRHGQHSRQRRGNRSEQLRRAELRGRAAGAPRLAGGGGQLRGLGGGARPGCPDDLAAAVVAAEPPGGRAGGRGGGALVPPAEEPAAGNALWLWLGVQAARMALLGDDDMGRLGRALRKPERASAGTDRFLLLLRRRCNDNSVVDGGTVVVPPRTGMFDLVTLYVPSLLRLLCARVACEVSEMILRVKRTGALAG